MTAIDRDPQRHEQRRQWLRQTLGDDQAELELASIDAGTRSHWRSRGHGASRILMDAPPGLDDPRPWLRMQRLLAAAGVRVPRVLAQNLDAGFLLLEDLGEPTLAQVLNEDNADTWFQAATRQLLTMQQIAPPDPIGRFDLALLQRDAGLFEQWFLGQHLGIVLSGDEAEQWQQIQRLLIDNTLAQATVLVHRDFMPRNLMPVADGPAVLDFQDCVLGPVAYDPLSLFKDTHVSWPLQRVDEWLARYHADARAAGVPVADKREQFLRDADWMGIQRHLKILGIFARLHYRDGKHWYLANVARFLHYLDEVLPRHPDLRGLRHLLEQRVYPALAARTQQ